MWKALYDAGVYVNVALYPAVQRGGALLRTSVSAGHTRGHLDDALEIFERVRDQAPQAPPPITA
jgi:8-amino-7-oxononanoate synthase